MLKQVCAFDHKKHFLLLAPKTKLAFDLISSKQLFISAKKTTLISFITIKINLTFTKLAKISKINQKSKFWACIQKALTFCPAVTQRKHNKGKGKEKKKRIIIISFTAS